MLALPADTPLVTERVVIVALLLLIAPEKVVAVTTPLALTSQVIELIPTPC